MLGYCLNNLSSLTFVLLLVPEIVREIKPSTSDDVTNSSRPTRMVIKRILTKIVTDDILQHVYDDQDAQGCKGCEENWPSQDEHECLFFGVAPTCRLYDYAPTYYDEAAERVQLDQVVEIFDAVNTILNVSESSDEGPNIDKHAIIQEIIDEWHSDPDDVARSFYSPFFNNLTELIDNTIQQLYV